MSGRTAVTLRHNMHGTDRVGYAGGGEMVRLSMAGSNTEPARTEIPVLNMKNGSSALLESYLCTPDCPARTATPTATCRR